MSIELETLIYLDSEQFGKIIYQVIEKDGDKITLEVLTDNNAGYDSTTGVYRYPDERVGTKVKDTVPSVLKQIRQSSNMMWIIPESKKQFYLDNIQRQRDLQQIEFEQYKIHFGLDEEE